jgi:hypothetical protein
MTSTVRHCVFLALILGLASPCFALTRIAVTVDEISSPTLNAKRFSASLSLGEPAGELNLKIGEFTNNGKRYADTEIHCARLSIERGGMGCKEGRLVESGEVIPLTFRVANSETFYVALQPKNESWQINSRRVGNDWSATIEVKDGAVTRFASLIPQTLPKLSKGTLSGRVELTTDSQDNAKIQGRVALKEIDFSDAAGLHAGEKIAAVIDLSAQRTGARWRFTSALDWTDGEMLWQPIYLAKGRRQLRASGTVDQVFIQIDSAEIDQASIGKVVFSGKWKLEPGALIDLSLKGRGLDLQPLFETWVKPFLDSANFSSFSASGRTDVELAVANGQVQRADVKLANASVADANNRFKIERLSMHIPWVNAGAGEGVIAFDSATVGGLPLGAVKAKVQFNGANFSLPELTVPILDGALKIKNVKARREGKDWLGEFEGEVAPISLPKLTAALQWPIMAGSLEGVIPRVRFDGKSIFIDGALQFKVFDGIMVATNMQLADALGAAPQLEGTLVMSNLDLDTLTKTFSFGKMQGRIDMVLENMLLSNWKPVSFDGRVMSSEGKYPRKISQQAVQNISSLGGAGAAAAIQRSFLRIFETFGYKKIGLTCQLRNTVCAMGGVADTAQGYVIVQGGGIPSITVMGYNRQVGWEELLGRIKAATQSNVGPVVK